MNTAISATTNNNYGGMSETVTARHDTTWTQKERERDRVTVTELGTLLRTITAFAVLFFSYDFLKKKKGITSGPYKRSSAF
jgi:hypothetical protein